MKTKNKKVQIEINIKDHDEVWLLGKSANFIFNPNTRNGEELFDFLSCCEEIHDREDEMIEMLRKIEDKLNDFHNDLAKSGIDMEVYNQLSSDLLKIKSLLQTLKQEK